MSLLTAALIAPAAAHANDFQDVYREYKRTGTVKPCRFSDKQLKNAQQQTPPDIEQYAPSFLDAVANARERSGDCNKKAAPAPAAAPAPTPSAPAPVPQQTTPAASPPPPPPPPAPAPPVEPHVTGVASPPVAHVKRVDATPAAVWLLGGLGGLALLGAVLAALAWWFGWDAERRLRPWKASIAEFAGRTSDARTEFVDWLRTGH